MGPFPLHVGDWIAILKGLNCGNDALIVSRFDRANSAMSVKPLALQALLCMPIAWHNPHAGLSVGLDFFVCARIARISDGASGLASLQVAALRAPCGSMRGYVTPLPSRSTMRGSRRAIAASVSRSRPAKSITFMFAERRVVQQSRFRVRGLLPKEFDKRVSSHLVEFPNASMNTLCEQ